MIFSSNSNDKILRCLYFDVPFLIDQAMPAFCIVFTEHLPATEVLESVQTAALGAICQQSLSVLLKLPATQKCLTDGRKATGQTKDLLSQIQNHVQSKKLNLPNVLHDAMRFLL